MSYILVRFSVFWGCNPYQLRSEDDGEGEDESEEDEECEDISEEDKEGEDESEEDEEGEDESEEDEEGEDVYEEDEEAYSAPVRAVLVPAPGPPDATPGLMVDTTGQVKTPSCLPLAIVTNARSLKMKLDSLRTHSG